MFLWRWQSKLLKPRRMRRGQTAHGATPFAAEFGHEEISDALVEAVDYSRGNTSMLTAEFIDSNSAPGMG